MVLVAVGQICSTASIVHNLAQCQNLVRRAAAAGAKALFLPEASDYIANNATQSLSLVQPTATSPFVQGLCRSAREHRIQINVGIHEPTDPPSNRLRNTLVWISTRGEIVHRYQKLHVFDIDLSATGGPKLKESESTEPGGDVGAVFDFEYHDDGNDDNDEELISPSTLAPITAPAPASASASKSKSTSESESTTTTSPGTSNPKPNNNNNNNNATRTIKIGSLICFDLRFPDPSSHLRRRQGAQILLYPSAFTVPTGKLHWEVMLRARAIENQCWAIAAAQCGRHNERRVSYGDSLVIDPQGVVVARLRRVDDEDEEKEEKVDGNGNESESEAKDGLEREEPSLLVVELDLDLVETVRARLPLKWRQDVFG